MKKKKKQKRKWWISNIDELTGMISIWQLFQTILVVEHYCWYNKTIQAEHMEIQQVLKIKIIHYLKCLLFSLFPCIFSPYKIHQLYLFRRVPHHNNEGPGYDIKLSDGQAWDLENVEYPFIAIAHSESEWEHLIGSYIWLKSNTICFNKWFLLNYDCYIEILENI